MKTYLFLILSLFVAHSANAQYEGLPTTIFDPLPDENFSFIIQDSSGSPIVGSEVCVTPDLGAQECRFSDGGGFVGFGLNPLGWYELKITTPGYNGELMAYLLYRSEPKVIQLTPGAYVPAPVCYPDEYSCERALGLECEPDLARPNCYKAKPPGGGGNWGIPFVGDGFLYADQACRFAGGSYYAGVSPRFSSIDCADACASAGADCCEWEQSTSQCTANFGVGAYLIPFTSLKSNIRPFSAPPTPPPVLPPDTTAPEISNVLVSDIKSTSVTITWISNERTDTRLTYGTTPAHTTAVAVDSSREFMHKVVLTGLTPDTPYYFVAKGRDAAQNLGFGPDPMTFNTKGTICNLCQ